MVLCLYTKGPNFRCEKGDSGAAFYFNLTVLYSRAWPVWLNGVLIKIYSAILAAAFASATKNITAHQGLQASGIDYEGVSPAVANGLSVFAANAGAAADTTPQAYTFQGYPKNFAIYGVVPDYITQAIKGEITLDEALAGIDADVAAKIAE